MSKETENILRFAFTWDATIKEENINNFIEYDDTINFKRLY